jgi:hypothetical protein
VPFPWVGGNPQFKPGPLETVDLRVSCFGLGDLPRVTGLMSTNLRRKTSLGDETSCMLRPTGVGEMSGEWPVIVRRNVRGFGKRVNESIDELVEYGDRVRGNLGMDVSVERSDRLCVL